MFRTSVFLCLLVAGSTVAVAQTDSKRVVHDAEYYILEAQHGEYWEAEDEALQKKLKELRKKYSFINWNRK